LVLKEKGVIPDGILEEGVAGIYLSEFDCEKLPMDYLNSTEWKQVLCEWEGYVRRVVENKSCPPKLY